MYPISRETDFGPDNPSMKSVQALHESNNSLWSPVIICCAKQWSRS